MANGNNATRSCFGTFLGQVDCKKCPAARPCKSVLISSGFDVVGAMVDQMVSTLPEGEYPVVEDSDFKAMAKALVSPPGA